MDFDLVWEEVERIYDDHIGTNSQGILCDNEGWIMNSFWVDCCFEIIFEDELDYVVIIDNDQCEWVTIKAFDVHTKKYLWQGENVHNKTSSATGHKLQQKGK